MNELLLHGVLAFFAGIALNLMPCVLPVMPFKIQAVLREIKSDLPSRILAAAALLAGRAHGRLRQMSQSVQCHNTPY